MHIHIAGAVGLLVAFAIGTTRPINLGALGLLMAYLLGTFVAGEGVREIYGGFPVDLLVLLVGVTYLFGIASTNGTVDGIVEGAARLVRRRRALVPWIVFAVAAMPAMAGALGSAGVAILAPIAMRLGERYAIDRRMIGLMVVHGAAAGNFSPLNVLSAIIVQSVARAGHEMSVTYLFAANATYNLALAVVIFLAFGGLRKPAATTGPVSSADDPMGADRRSLTRPQAATLLVLVAVAVAAFGYGLAIGFVALAAAIVLHLCFPSSSAGADRHIAWNVVLLVCGIVTYVAALQRYGTVDAAGLGIAGLGSPIVTSLLLCGLAALTSAFASSAGVLSAVVPLAMPLIAQTGLSATLLVTAVALSATVVDAAPFSTVGALAVASATPDERRSVYRGLLAWGALMVFTAPVVTVLVFIWPAL